MTGTYVAVKYIKKKKKKQGLNLGGVVGKFGANS